MRGVGQQGNGMRRQWIVGSLILWCSTWQMGNLW